MEMGALCIEMEISGKNEIFDKIAFKILKLYGISIEMEFINK